MGRHYVSAVVSAGYSVAVPGVWKSEGDAIAAAVRVGIAERAKLIGHTYVHVSWVETMVLEMSLHERDLTDDTPAEDVPTRARHWGADSTHFCEVHSHGTFKLKVEVRVEGQGRTDGAQGQTQGAHGA